MKILQINTVYAKGSTGKIALEIHDFCKKSNIECVTGYRYMEKEEHDDSVAISSFWDCHIHNRLVRYTGLQGCFSRIRTYKFLKIIDLYKPDIIQLHNIHGSFINHGMLFRYIKKKNIKVVWTLHDCWPFTGICPHFTLEKCDKWKTECCECPFEKKFLLKFLKSAKRLYHLKKKWYTGIQNMIIITPSKWLNNLVKESFLKEYPSVVINNGINLDIFKPEKSDLRVRYGISDSKKILLGVAFGWGYRKGLDVFIELAQRLDCDKYQIVLVGTNSSIDKKLPNTIISINRTNDQKELAKIYSAADLFINPTREEMFGLVNVEANACGTPVVTFCTGGCPECITDKSGSVVKYNDIDALEKEIIKICENNIYDREMCIQSARRFDKEVKYKEYINLYEEFAQK